MLALAERPCGYQVLSSQWFHARLFPRVFAVRTSLKGSHLQETPPWDVHRRSQKSVSTCNARTASISVRVLLVTVVALENSSDSCTPICVPGWESHRCSGNGQSEWIWIFQFRTIWMLLCNALDEIWEDAVCFLCAWEGVQKSWIALLPKPLSQTVHSRCIDCVSWPERIWNNSQKQELLKDIERYWKAVKK